MTIQSNLTTEQMKLQPSSLIELFILDTTPIGLPSVSYFHCGTDDNREPIVFQGQQYEPFPVQITGFEYDGQGALPTPSMSVSNIGGWLSQTLIQYQDMVGSKVTRKRTFRRFLDSEKTADPTQEYPLDIYYIGRKTAETCELVTFDLVSSLDLTGVTLPSRQIIQNSCPWVYKSAECSWVPRAGYYFDVNDNAVQLPGADVCGKRLTSCKLRFAANGANPVMPYGGFPGARKYA